MRQVHRRMGSVAGSAAWVVAALLAAGCGGAARREFTSIRASVVMPARPATTVDLALLDSEPEAWAEVESSAYAVVPLE